MRVRERALACGMLASAANCAWTSSPIRPSLSNWPSLQYQPSMSNAVFSIAKPLNGRVANILHFQLGAISIFLQFT